MRVLIYLIVCFCFFVSSVFADDTALILYVNRWPETASNVIVKVGSYVFHGDGEVIAVYDTTTDPDLTPVARVSVRLTPKEELGEYQAAGTEGISGMFYDDVRRLLYVACGNEGLQIYNVPADPGNFSATDLRGHYIVDKGEGMVRAVARDVAAVGNYAYIVYHWISPDPTPSEGVIPEGYDSGIQTIDASDPANPMLVGEAECPEAAVGLKRMYSFFVENGYAYAIDMYNGLVIFDLNNPAAPEVEAVSYITGAMDVSVSGNYAYIACGGYGLAVVNVDPNNFTPEKDILPAVGYCQYDDTSSKAVSVVTDGGYAYIGDVDLGFLVADISSPESIDDYCLIGQYYDDAQGAYRLSLDSVNHVVYVGDCRKGLQKIDISDPTHPALLADIDDTGTPADADTVVIDDKSSYAFTADDDPTIGTMKEGVRIFFAVVSEDYVTYLLKGMLPTDGEANDIYSFGDYLYVADGSGGLKIIDPGLSVVDEEGNRDTSGPVNPFLKGSCGFTGTANGVFVKDDDDNHTYAYVAAGTGGLKVIDVSDPTSPNMVGEISGADVSDARKVTVKGDYAFIADGDNGLKVVYMSPTDKSDLTLVSSYYIGDGDDLDTVPGCARDVNVVGTLAYVAAYNEGLYVLDLANPNIPVWVANYSADPFEQVKGIYAARSNESEGVDLIWVANGTAWDVNMGFFTHPSTVPPQLAAMYHSAGDVRDIFVLSDFVIIADGAGGFQTLIVSEGETITDDDIGWDDDVEDTDIHHDSHHGGGSSWCFIGTLLSDIKQ